MESGRLEVDSEHLIQKQFIIILNLPFPFYQVVSFERSLLEKVNSHWRAGVDRCFYFQEPIPVLLSSFLHRLCGAKFV